MKSYPSHVFAPLFFVVLFLSGVSPASDLSWAPIDQGVVAAFEGQTPAPDAPFPCSYLDVDAGAPTQTASDCGLTESCYSSCCTVPRCSIWTIDYLVRPYFDSHTSYQFGTSPNDPDWPPPGYAPLSKLTFGLDSTWTGLRVGLQRPDAAVHFEWLAPLQQNINGNMVDYDWNINVPRNDPTRLDSMTLSSERWNEGQMLDLGLDVKATDGVLGMPIEIWPMIGFRWQRFNITASGLDYRVPPLGPQPQYDGVDVITFSQQYYLLYVGGQLRTEWWCLGRPVALKFQGDWSGTWGYNVDHHLLRSGGDRYTMEGTSGGATHLALIAEIPVMQNIIVGIQADHLAIHTTGWHRMYWPSQGADLKWTNGVEVNSSQTSITAFLRACF